MFMEHLPYGQDPSCAHRALALAMYNWGHCLSPPLSDRGRVPSNLMTSSWGPLGHLDASKADLRASETSLCDRISQPGQRAVETYSVPVLTFSARVSALQMV